MRSVFRKRQTTAQVDDIPDDLLATIPDVDAKAGAKEGNPFAPLVHAEEEPFPAEEAPAASHAANGSPNGKGGKPRRGAVSPEADVAALVADVRRQMEAVFSRELAKVEDSFTAVLRQMEGRLEKAQAEAEGLRRENDDLLRVKAEYDRKAEALKELARSFEKA